MIVVGVTGGLATGKTTVAGMLAQKGARVLDADTIAADGMRPGQKIFKKVVRRFGPGVVTDGKIDRRALADIVFRDETQRRILEGIVHPYVAAELKKELNALRREKAEVVVLDVPLLFESGFDRMTDIAIVVKADRATQIARSMKRLSLPRGEAIRRIRAQMPIKEKMRRADIVIDNKGSSGETRKQVNRVWDMLRRRYFKI